MKTISMTGRVLVLAALLAPAGSSFGASEQAGAAAQNKAVNAAGFSAYEIYDFKDDTSCLKTVDINGDGQDDIIFANNRTSRIEILIRKKNSGEAGSIKALDEVFRNAGFIVDQKIRDIEIADVNGDGNNDIIINGSPYGIQIYYMSDSDKVEFSSPVKPYSGKDNEFIGILVEDIDGDSRADIIASRRNSAEILFNSRKGFSPDNRKTITYTSDSCSYFSSGYFSGTDKKDLLLYFDGNEMPLRILQGRKGGAFGWEIPIELSNVQLFLDIQNKAKKSPFCGEILRNMGVFRTVEVSFKEKEKADQNEITPLRMAVRGGNPKESSAWLVADFNKDSYDDLCIASPDHSKLLFYYGSKNGFAPEPVEMDSLAGIQKLYFSADENVIYAFSPREKRVVCHKLKNPSAFPVTLKRQDAPLALARYGKEFYSVIKEAKGSPVFEIFTADENGNTTTLKSMPLQMKNTPGELTVFPLSDSNETGIVFFVPFQSPELYKYDGEKLTKIQQNDLSLAASVKSLGIMPFKNDDGYGIIVCEKNLARQYLWKNGAFTPVRQFNPSDPAAELLGVCKALGPDSNESYMFYDRSSDDFLYFPLEQTERKEGKAAFRRVHIKGGIKDFQGIREFSLDGVKGIFMAGRDEISIDYPGAQRGVIVNKGEYVSSAEKPYIWNFYPVKCRTADKNVDAVALLDKNNRSIDLLSVSAEGELEKLLSFEVFQETQFAHGNAARRFEPHDLASGDINGDGIPDLVVLVHDKLIIYFGE